MKKALGETKKEEKKEKMAHQKKSQKADRKGGVGVNAYGQPYHKISSVFIDAFPLIVHW